MENKEKVTPTVGVLIYSNDEVLLVKHGEKAKHITGVYGLPAGRLKDKESELEAAVRELNEETGLVTSKEDLVEMPGRYTRTIQRKDGVGKFSLKVFLCKKYSGKLRGTEETSPEWIKISELKKYPLTPSTEIAVKNGLKYR